MRQLADAGILVGTSMMPIFPYIGDDRTQLEEVVQLTKDHGGICVLGGGLTMDGIQAERTLSVAMKIDPLLEPQWRKLYSWKESGKPNIGPNKQYNARLGLILRELCEKHSILDRMPRYILPGPLAINRRIAELLFLKTYNLELELASSYQIWAYRKAAWTMDELPDNILEIYHKDGEAGLRRLPNIGKSIAGQIENWIKEEV